ncbi:hypothetical protein ACVWYU_004227 [Pseudomonas sp. TE12234]
MVLGGIHFFGNGGWRFRLTVNHLEKRNAAPVGASLLAMVGNDDAGCLNARVVPQCCSVKDEYCICGERACSRWGAKCPPKNGTAAQSSGSKLPRHRLLIARSISKLNSIARCPGVFREQARSHGKADGRTPKTKKAPQKRGHKGCSSHASGGHAFGRLSNTWHALPSDRLIECKGCKTIRELIPI